VRGLRVRYWRLGTKTVWIMEEIGKELPITIGVAVNQGSINQGSVEQVKILAFRESRGWEVRYPAFTAQYLGVQMTPGKKLDTHIDGITGATLSVRAVTKVATLALFYHQQVISVQNQPSQNKETSPLVTETP
ncbi:MAG: FMN-binding protein, partial [Porticoccus sp.]